MSADGIVWEDPPQTSGRGLSKEIAGFFDQLRAHPGKWAIWFKPEPHNTGLASQINSGRYKAAPKGEFEAASRTQPSGLHRVYVRYVGDEATS